MNTNELINAVTAHLQNLASQHYTVCAESIARAVVNAGAALGLCICGGQFDPDAQTRVLYTDYINR